MINASQKAAVGSKDNTRSQSIFYSFSFAAGNGWKRESLIKSMCTDVFIQRKKSNYVRTMVRKFYKIVIDRSLTRDHYDLG